MAAGKYTFFIEQGATTDFELVWKDNNGDPVDLSSYSARMQIRTDYGGSLICSLSSSLDTDGTGLNLSGSNGTTPLASGSIGIFISAASSSAFTFGEAKYDLELEHTSTRYVTRLIEGKVKLSKEVTV